AKSKADIYSNLSIIVPRDVDEGLKEEFANIAEGKSEFEWQSINYTLSGEQRVVNLHWSAPPGHENTMDKILLSRTDLTESRRKEEQIRILSKFPAEN